MDLLKEVYDLKETVGHKIAQANKKIKANGGDIANEDVDIVDKLSHSIKSLVTTCAMLEAEEDGGYSGAYAPMYPATYTTGGYSGRNQYSPENRNGYSGNNGGYSRNGYSRENRNGYSRNGGYSRTGDMTDQLRQMMDEAPDEMTRKEIEKLVDQMENRR